MHFWGIAAKQMVLYSPFLNKGKISFRYYNFFVENEGAHGKKFKVID